MLGGSGDGSGTDGVGDGGGFKTGTMPVSAAAAQTANSCSCAPLAKLNIEFALRLRNVPRNVKALNAEPNVPL